MDVNDRNAFVPSIHMNDDNGYTTSKKTDIDDNGPMTNVKTDNDDNGHMSNKKTDNEDDDNNDRKVYKSFSYANDGKKVYKSSPNINDRGKLHKSSSNINDHSKHKNLGHEQINKTSSNSNVFSRLMHSEPHVQLKKKLLINKTGCCLLSISIFLS